VRNEQIAETPFLLKFFQQIENLCLYRDIEGTGRLIADDKPRIDRQCPGDTDTLTLSP